MNKTRLFGDLKPVLAVICLTFSLLLLESAIVAFLVLPMDYVMSLENIPVKFLGMLGLAFCGVTMIAVSGLKLFTWAFNKIDEMEGNT
jgi:hypothetical protein